MNALTLAENGWLPYWLIRFGIRQRVARKLQSEAKRDPDERHAFIQSLGQSPIARDTDKANEQHYELPAVFFQLVLGKRLKYSCAFWPDACSGLNEAEEHALKQIEERAQLEDGQDVLDMGCGWGSFSLWAAPRYPRSSFLAVSNSRSQASFIRNQARLLGLRNLEVITKDMNLFQPSYSFDRIVSVEMLEHMRNYDKLFERIAGWLAEDGRLFVHVFSHRQYTYPYEAEDASEWMARYFFTGGIMPSHQLLPSFDKHLETEMQWQLDGQHYQKTAEAWLENFNRNEKEIQAVLQPVYGEQTKQWMWRWRLFLLACSELFGYKDGKEWGVSHYRIRKRR